MYVNSHWLLCMRIIIFWKSFCHLNLPCATPQKGAVTIKKKKKKKQIQTDLHFPVQFSLLTTFMLYKHIPSLVL